jgi:hypothetical protein
MYHKEILILFKKLKLMKTHKYKNKNNKLLQLTNKQIHKILHIIINKYKHN